MTEVEKLNNQLCLIRVKIKKNTKALSGKIIPNKVKLLQREKAKLEKNEEKLLSSIQKAVKKSEREQKKEVKSLKHEIGVKNQKIDSLQRQAPMMAEEVDDDNFEDYL